MGGVALKSMFHPFTNNHFFCGKWADRLDRNKRTSERPWAVYVRRIGECFFFVFSLFLYMLPPHSE